MAPAHVDGERLAARARVRFMDEVLPAGNSHVADVTRWFGGNSIVQPCACWGKMQGASATE